VLGRRCARSTITVQAAIGSAAPITNSSIAMGGDSSIAQASAISSESAIAPTSPVRSPTSESGRCTGNASRTADRGPAWRRWHGAGRERGGG
jgi:hypothetical protein